MVPSLRFAATALIMLSAVALAGAQSEVALIELQSNPLAFQGRTVTVAGYLTYSSRDIIFGMLSLDTDQNAHDEGIAVWPQGRMVKDHEKCNAMFVKLIGRIVVSRYLQRGPLDGLVYPQIVADKCTPWSNPERPRFRQEMQGMRTDAEPRAHLPATAQHPPDPPDGPVGLVSFVELRGNPLPFNGKRVLIRGYLRFGPTARDPDSSAALYLDRIDADNELGNEVEVIPSAPMLKETDNINNRYVEIQGIVKVRLAGAGEGTAVTIRVDQQSRACIPWPDQ